MVPEGVAGISGISGSEKLTSITIPDSVTYIDGCEFEGCSGLNEIVVSNSHPSYATDENGILYNKDRTEIIRCPLNKSGEVVIPQGVIKIGEYAFDSCEKLSSIVIAEGVTAIMSPWDEDGTFTNCTGLTSITIPKSMVSIGQRAFGDCTNLKEVYYAGSEQQWNQIEIQTGNIPLRQAVIHFNNSNNDAGADKGTVTDDKNTPNTLEPAKIEITNVELSKNSLTYTGKALKPTVVAKDGAGNVVGVENYDVVYSNNKKVGQATVTVTFKGDYKGTITTTFTIIPKGTKISKIAAEGDGFLIKWKKQKKQTTGYELQYSTSKKFKGAKSVKIGKNKITSKSISNLKAKKKYYVRIRTYKTVKINGKATKLYSEWSKAKRA